jgi:tyrosyl-tRNA synthetase
LTEAQVRENAKTYQEQVFKILDPDRTKIGFNSKWLNPLNLSEFMTILMTTTVGQLLTRDDFSERLSAEQPIYLHEFLYPILQGYDSVAMKADLELGGTDQKFNLLMGRWLQKCGGMPQQAVLIMPLLEGLDGIHKMSKSMNNCIGLTDSAKDIFGKIMSISDPLMLRYYELLSAVSLQDLDDLKVRIHNGQLHPMDAKKRLASEMVDRYHGIGVGRQECQRFEEHFSKKSLALDVSVVQVQPDASGRVHLVKLFVDQNYVQSKSEARRLLQQKGVKVNGEVFVSEWLSVEPQKEYFVRVGKIHSMRVVSGSG